MWSEEYKVYDDATSLRFIFNGCLLILAPFLGIIFVIFLAIVMLFRPSYSVKCIEKEFKRIELVSFYKNTVGSTGQFFMGDGYVETRLYYIYYFKTEDGSISADKADAAYFKVYEEDISTAYKVLTGTVTVYSEGKASGFLEELSVALIPQRRRETVSGLTWSFHVPKGTIAKEVKLEDLKASTSLDD